MVNPEENPSFTAVISTGRTGTVFLTHLINNHAGHEVAVHEPYFSRLFYLLGNLFSHYGWSRSGLVRLYMAMRKFRIGSAKDYIELNPFLCPLADLLADIPYTLKVVHLVRDPRTWVPSLISHEASGRRKFLIRKVPFNLPRDRRFGQAWNALTLVEKMIYRWSALNRTISKLEHSGCQYELFRHEDLFSSNAETLMESRGRFLWFLDLEPDFSESGFRSGKKYNVSCKLPQFEFSNWTEREKAFMQEIAGDQLSRFQYQ